MIWKRLLSLMLVTAVLVFVGCDNPTNSDNSSGGDDTAQDDTSDDGTSDSDDWFNETPLEDSSDSDTDGGADYTVALSDLTGTYEYSDGFPSNDRTLTISDTGDVTWENTEYDSVSIDGFTMTADDDTYYILGNSTGDKFLIADGVYGVHYPTDTDVTLSDIFDDVDLGEVKVQGNAYSPEYVFELTTGAGARGVKNVTDLTDGWKKILNEDDKAAYFDSEITGYDGDSADVSSKWEFNEDNIRFSFSYLTNTAPTDAENSTMVMTPADVSYADLDDRIVVNATPADIQPGLTINASNVALESDPDDTTIDLNMTFGFADGQSVDDYESVKIERQVPGFEWQVLEDDVKSTISNEIDDAGDWIYEDTSAEIPRAYNYRVTLETPSGKEFVTTTNLLDPLVHCPAVDVEKTGNTGVSDNVGTYTFTAIEHAPVTVNVVKPDGSKLTAITLQHPDNSVTVGPEGSDSDFEVSNDNSDDISYDVSFTRVFSFPDDPNEEEYTTGATGETNYTLYK